MPADANNMQRFTRAQIEAFMTRCFAATGMPDADAATVAHLMAEGDMLGIPGCRRSLTTTRSPCVACSPGESSNSSRRI